MLRILLFLLALISVALAVILEMPWVLGIAAVLLIVLITVWAMAARKRKRSSKKAASPESSSEPDRELASLGISDIRPKGSAEKSEREAEPKAAPSAPPEEPAKRATTPTSTSTPDGVRPASVQRLSTRRRSQDTFNTIADDRFAQIMGPYLQSIRAATGLQTICLLKQEDVEPHYSIEAIVSQNSYARSSGQFHTRQPYVASAGRQRMIVKPIGGEDGFDPSMLGYYREPIAVRQLAVVPVPPSSSSASYLLIADTMNEGELSEPYRQGLLTQFSDLLRSILDMLELEEKLDSGEPARPRREIIQEEMTRARDEGKQLMFALVYLNEAEEIASDGRMAIAAAERALEAALSGSSGDRVERFGELTFGVFRSDEEVDVESWAAVLQQQVESGRGALKGGAAIGIVVMGERHDTPEALREDATQALREAFETGACTILE